MIICPDDDTLLTPILVDTLIGTVLADRYEIQEKLGTGGMGLVYKAKHLLMKRLVAIKLMLPQYASNAVALKRFQHEAQAASHLNHPNILTVHDFGVTPQGQPYLVMDLLEGTNLSAVLEADGYLRVDRALNIFAQTCSALAHAHQKNVIHRDLKPGNIMLVEYEGRSDWVQIVDFGMAKILSAVDGEKEDLTRAGEVFGSPMYMSPEQCMAKELDARSDIYSMGCVMYRTLTGRPAVAGTTAMECFNKHANGEPAPFASICPELNLSANLEAIVFKAMAKDPADRFQSMLDLRDALLEEAQSMVEISLTMPVGTITKPLPLIERSLNDVPMSPLPEQSLHGNTQAKVQAAADAQSISATQPDTLPRPTIPTPESILLQNSSIISPEAGVSQSQGSFADQTIVPVAAPSAYELKPAKTTPKAMITAAVVGLIIIGAAAYFAFGHGSKGNSGAGQETGQGATGNTTGGAATGAAGAGKSPATVKDLMTQGHASFEHGDYSEAQKRFNQALELARTNSDYEHGVPEARLWLGRTYFETEDFDKAKEQFQELIKVRENAHELTAVDATEAMNYLGNIYVSKKDFGQSKRWFDQALRIRKSYKGDDYGRVAETLAGLGNLSIRQGQWKQAKAYLQEAEKIAQTSKAIEEVDKAKIYNALGQAYQSEGQLDKAQQYYVQALSIRQRNLNPENPAIADTLVLMGALQFGKHNLADSEKLLKQALDIQLKALGPDSLSVATTKVCLGVLYHREKKTDLAKPLVQDALRIRQQELGPKDPDTIETKKFLKSL